MTDDQIEQLAGFSFTSQGGITGAPITIKFAAPMYIDVFTRFVQSAFEPDSRFGMIGNPITLDLENVHVIAVSLREWQRINFELHPDRFVIVLPVGTSAQVLRHFCANLQSVTGSFTVFIGDTELTL